MKTTWTQTSLKQAENNNMSKLLNEGLEFKEMVGMIKPTVHIDEFASKMGDDDDIIVASFFVRSKEAARDLVNWFEKGYDWILDADTSPGEIKPGRFLVYIEFQRRSSAGRNIAELLQDLSTLTEHEQESNWTLTYEDADYPFSVETFDQLVPLSPRAYRSRKEKRLNEIRTAAGVETVATYEADAAIKKIQSAAGF